MKFSYSWLCEHLETDKNATEIGDALTNIGLELESLSDYSSYSKFVVATIKDIKKHPNADRLNICKVDDGTNTYLSEFFTDSEESDNSNFIGNFATGISTGAFILSYENDEPNEILLGRQLLL